MTTMMMRHATTTNSLLVLRLAECPIDERHTVGQVVLGLSFKAVQVRCVGTFYPFFPPFIIILERMGAPNGPLPGGKGDTAPPCRRSSSSRPQQSSPARSTTKPPPLSDSPPSPLPSPTSLKHRRVPELKHRSQQGTQTDLLLAAAPPANQTATPMKKLPAGVIPTPAPVPTCQDSASTGHAASDPYPMAAPGLDEVMAFLTDHGFARAASALRDDVRARTAAVLDPQLPPLRMPGSVSGGGDTPASGSPRSSSAASSACPGLPSRSYADVVRTGGCLAAGSVGQRPPPATGHSKRVKFSSHIDSVKFSMNLPPAQSLWRCSKAPCCNIQQEIHSILKKTSAARSSIEKRNTSVPTKSAMKPNVVDEERQQLDISDACPKHINTFSSSPTSIQSRSEQSLAFKRWAWGRCYRCLAHDHQVRSCKNPFRCIRCGGPGHRERYCRISPASPRVHSYEGLQHYQLAQSQQQTKPLQGHQHTGGWDDNASTNLSSLSMNFASGSPWQGQQLKVPPSSLAPTASLDTKSTGMSLLDALRPELECMVKTFLERMMCPVREELSTIKLWLARVATHVECIGQERRLSSDVPASNSTELFGPYSPVRLSPSSALLDSLVAAHTSVDPSICEGGVVDITKAEPAAETTQEIPFVEPIGCEDACEDRTVSFAAPPVEQPVQEEHRSMEVVGQAEGIDELILDATTSIKDGKNVIFPTPTTRAKRKPQPHDKASLRRSDRLTSYKILKDLGFIRKSGKLNEDKLEDFAELLKEILPPDLLIWLFSLKDRVFWKTLAKIFVPLR